MVNIWTYVNTLYSKLKDLSKMQLANFSSVGIFAFFWFYMANELGSEHYGEIIYYIAIANLVSLLVNIGASNTIGVYVAKKIKIQSTLYFISIITSTIGSVVLFFVLSNVGASILAFGLLLSSITTSEILGNKLYGIYTKYHLFQKILAIGLAFLFYYLIDYQGIIIGLGLSHLVYIKRFYDGFRDKIDFSLLKPRFGFMMNSYILNIFSALYGTVDKILVAPLLGFALLGNYALGLQFLAVITLFPTTVYEYIIPQYATGISNNKLRRATIALSIVLALFGVILSPIAVPVFFPEYPDSIQVIQILSLLAIPQTISMMYSARFFGYEKSRYVVIGTVISLGIQIPAIILLGLTFGINGVALAMLLSSTAGCLYSIFINRKLSKEGLF